MNIPEKIMLIVRKFDRIFDVSANKISQVGRSMISVADSSTIILRKNLSFLTGFSLLVGYIGIQ